MSRLPGGRWEATKSGATHAQKTYLLLAAAVVAVPAAARDAKSVAADQKQCADQFKAADLNNDGVLSRTEIGNAKQKLPSSLANRDRVARKDFMAVCGKSAS